MSTSAFTLDSTIFNPTLHDSLTGVWFSDVRDLRGETLDSSVLKRWFLLSGAERDAFDSKCRANFAHALDAIGPEQLPTPTAQPFLDEIFTVKERNGSEQAAWTALSLTLLLDQIPRNIYRTNAGLRKVYTHYDAISYALARTLLSAESPVGRLDTHPQWRQSAAHRFWFYMPLMHSEDLEAHAMLDAIINDLKTDCEGLKGSEIIIEGEEKAEKEHREILERFGRYPHRNEALRRVSTQEEVRFLDEGGATFGVKQGTRKDTTS